MEEEIQDNKKHWVLRNLLFAAIFVVAIALVADIALAVFTKHGKVITVPDMTNMSVAEAERIADSSDVRISVIDSIYVRGMAKGAVYRQNPAAGTDVKNGRRVLLTINAVVPKKVTMPNLVGYSMRQAKAELSSKGLVLGRLKYVEDIATNNVIKQQIDGQDVAAGTSVESGSIVDLVVGLNPSENMTYVPKVLGMKYLRAVDVMRDNSLNIKKLNFDSSVRSYSDSVNAVVYRQRPENSMSPVLMGSEVTLYLSVDKQL